MTARQRADRLLVERGLFDCRARAQAAIAAGLVTADGVPVRKASDAISTAAAIEAAPEHPYVSRGGVKLAAALDEFALDVTGRVCLDVGASTGGFGAFVMQALAEHGVLDRGLKIRSMVLPDVFIDQDSPNAMYAKAGLDAKGIVTKAFEALGQNIRGDVVKIAR